MESNLDDLETASGEHQRLTTGSFPLKQHARDAFLIRRQLVGSQVALRRSVSTTTDMLTLSRANICIFVVYPT